MIIDEMHMQQQTSYFDTHATVKRLQGVGLSMEVAEEITKSIAIGRDRDLSMITTKEDFFELKDSFTNLKDDLSQYKQDNAFQFAKIDSEISIIKADIIVMKADIGFIKADIVSIKGEIASIKETMATKADLEALRKDTRTDMESLRKDTKNNLEGFKKDILVELAKNKNETVKWMIGIFAVLAIGIFIKPYIS